MADNEDSITQNEDVAPGDTPESPGQETVYGAEVLDFMNRRQSELGDGEESEDDSEDGTEETLAVEPEAAPEPVQEPASKAARRAFAKEKRLRAERAELQAEREAWKSESQEATEKVSAYEKSKQDAITDPLSHLKEIGLSDDDVMDLAREIYYRNMPEQATPAVRAEMAAIERDRRLRKLERKGEIQPEPEQEPEPTGPTPEYQAYESQYKENLSDFAEAIDPGEFPLSAAYAEQDFNDLVQGMFNAAVQNAQKTNGKGGDLSPQECMARIESHLRASQPATPAEDQTEKKPEQNRTAKLRNKRAAQQPNDKHEDDMTYDELKAESQRRFQSSMREKGLIL